MSCRFICITGPDGSGKSTLANALVKKFIGTGVEASLLDIHAIAKQLNLQELDLQRYLLQLKPQARFLFFCHALQHAYDLSHANLIVAPGYWYKYAVTESFYGLDPSYISLAQQNLPRPDTVFYLECEPAVAAARKTKFTNYETMGHPDHDGFIAAQHQLSKFWNAVRDPSWISLPDDDLATKLQKIVRNLQQRSLVSGFD